MDKLIKKIAIEGILTSLSVVIGILDHQLGVIGIKFLNLMYLLPIFFAKDIFGTKSGISCLFFCKLNKINFF